MFSKFVSKGAGRRYLESQAEHSDALQDLIRATQERYQYMINRDKAIVRGMVLYCGTMAFAVGVLMFNDIKSRMNRRS